MSPQDVPKSPFPRTDKIVVEVMSGPEDGREIRCDRFPVTIGRSNENSVGISCDHLISRRHASIESSEEGFAIEDLKSTNGTFIGNRRIQKVAPLQADELFRVGATLLRIRSHPKGSRGRGSSNR